VQCNTTVYEMVSAMDQMLASEVGNAYDLAELAGLVHCAALATYQVLGCKVRTRDETNATQQKSKSDEKPIPTWKKRIEEKSTEPDVISPILPNISKKRKLE
jgi:hypothetical protein